jgi:hypothetical protein
MSKEKNTSIPVETLMSKIYFIRGVKVMLDKDLAELYDIETKRLKEQVRRNIERFPEDFMFEMTKQELEDWRSQFATSNKEVMGLRVAPFVFTEHGVLMLSSILNSQRAIKVNIQIMRIFTKMKEMILTHKEILLQLEKMEKKMTNHDEDIAVFFSYLKQLLKSEDQKNEQSSRKRIGLKRAKNNEKPSYRPMGKKSRTNQLPHSQIS